MKTPPTPPSIRYANSGAPLRAEIAEKRSSSPSLLIGRLRDEIDWITMKCMEKNPLHRYDGVDDLIEDLEAFLQNEPVSIAKENVTYRIGKYVRNKRPSYAIWVEIPAIILFGAALFMYWQATSINGLDASNGNENGVITFTEKSIAVLPLKDLSEESGHSSLSEGLHNDLSIGLSRLPDFLVMHRNATLPFHDTLKSPKEIGNELGVRYVVLGSIRQEESNIRIDIELIDALTERYIWVEKFVRDRDNLTLLQDEISQAIDDQLGK